jgi:hypothetical protein
MKGKKLLLYLWIKDRRWAKTSDVVEWGIRNFYISAERVARTLAEEGRIRRATDEEKMRMFRIKMGQDVWLCEEKTR